MPWFTNKETGGKFNTDWLDEDYKRKYAQIHFNESVADQMNEQEKEDDFTRFINSRLGKPDIDPNLSVADQAVNRIKDCFDNNKINPNYETFISQQISEGRYRMSYDPRYRTNCALCTTAVALQARGYDVEAMPRDEQWRGALDVFAVDFSNPDNYMASNSATRLTGAPCVRTYFNGNQYIQYSDGRKYDVQNPSITPRGSKAVAKAVIDKVHKWGNGAVGDLSILWKSRNSAHSVAIVNMGGKAYIYDSQSNDMYSEDKFEIYFSRTTANTTSLVRLDNAKFKGWEVIGKLDKMVKRRELK